jgi:uncharacterized membrane protein (DUF485 family)
MEGCSGEMACCFVETESINFHFRELKSRAAKFSSLLSFQRVHKYSTFLVFSLFYTLLPSVPLSTKVEVIFKFSSFFIILLEFLSYCRGAKK